ncbi:MAG: SDR family oxidoreductase [Betaproteobacteria bacterium]
MSRVLVFGGDGLLGSHLYLAMKDEHDLCLTFHGRDDAYPAGLFSGASVLPFVSAGDKAAVVAAIDTFQPDWVVNAIGLVKRDLADDPLASLEANTLFPHLLANICAERSVKLLHFSTDCVFSGLKGGYNEADIPDCQAWHGRCKALGEPAGSHVLVLRTSFIGLELGCKKSLVEWFLAQQGEVKGYRRAIWSGLPAIEIGRLVSWLSRRDEFLSGLWHVSTPPISKFELLTALNDRLGERGVKVVADDSFRCNRSLDGSAFEKRSGYVPPSWDEMLDELAEDIRLRWSPVRPSYWSF